MKRRDDGRSAPAAGLFLGIRAGASLKLAGDDGSSGRDPLFPGIRAGASLKPVKAMLPRPPKPVFPGIRAGASCELNSGEVYRLDGFEQARDLRRKEAGRAVPWFTSVTLAPWGLTLASFVQVRSEGRSECQLPYRQANAIRRQISGLTLSTKSA
ncbi:hypothetical protein [Elioraea tepidiphila]|uniref:hypothetical protein n=1 Tax=Elioraea tepidiphila TaxID=457934 RepID=UPI003CCC2BB0